MSEYTEQAVAFAKKYGVTLATEYQGTYPRFGKTPVANFKCTLARNGKSLEFTFSMSVNDSWCYSKGHASKRFPGLPFNLREEYQPKVAKQHVAGEFVITPIVNPKPPTMYDVLACLQKYDPGTFPDFCREYGYDDRPLSEYPKVMETWQAVVNEYINVRRLFPEEEVQEELGEIS
jgi:hypothetical protein